MKAPRWMIRAAVVLTALLCLGVAGYAGQVWWARVIAERFLDKQTGGPGVLIAWDRQVLGPRWNPQLAEMIVDNLRNYDVPWYGGLDIETHAWVPRCSCYVCLQLITGQSLSNDPSAWEAWFKAHPDLVWDDKLKRLVEKP